MGPMDAKNIESELSYAYLHAVASKAGISCKISNRHEDNNGIDAGITEWGPFPGGGELTEIDLKIQLKATTKKPVPKAGHIPYFLSGVARYDDLRSLTLAVNRILVVLFLPENKGEWLEITADNLILRKCAYWVCLRGAAASENDRGETVYLPENQIFTPEQLQNICTKLSRSENYIYTKP